MVQKPFGQVVMFGFLIFDWVDSGFVQMENLAVWIGHQDGGVGGDEKLASGADEPVDFLDESELAGRRERSFGFVHDDEAFFDHSMSHNRQEGFSMGTSVEGFSPRARVAPWVFALKSVVLVREVENGFRAHEEPIRRHSRRIGAETESVVQPSVSGAEIEKISVARNHGRAPDLYKTESNRNRLDNGGLARSVFPDKEGDGGMELNFAEVLDGRDIERETFSRRNDRPIDCGAPEKSHAVVRSRLHALEISV
jgi:hypothetical protein